MRHALLLAGIGQLALALASLALPGILRWRDETRRLSPLTRHIFWTYAAYILGINITFGLASVLAPDALLEPTPLARAVCALISLYWGARLGIQLVLFRRHKPAGAWFAAADAGVTLLFLYLTAVYLVAALPSRGGAVP